MTGIARKGSNDVSSRLPGCAHSVVADRARAGYHTLRRAMLERGRGPVRCPVTRIAGHLGGHMGSGLSRGSPPGPMAGRAVSGGPAEHPLDMTGLTGHANMGAI